NARLVRKGGWISCVPVHHAGNALHGHSLRALLLLGLQAAARGAVQPPSYGMAASLLFASPLDRNFPKCRRVDLLARVGRLCLECFSALLFQVQSPRRSAKRLLQAHSASAISASSTLWSRAAYRLATLHPPHRLHQYALVLLPSVA